MTEDEKFWRQFEARDRAKNPHAWAIHDHAMDRLQRKQPNVSAVLLKGMIVIIAILLAIIITT